MISKPLLALITGSIHPLDSIAITIVLYKYSDTLEVKLQLSQLKSIEQNTGSTALLDIPIINRPTVPPSIKSPAVMMDFTNDRRNIDEETLNTIFLDKKEETKLQKARKILGEEVAGVPDEELGVYIAEFQFLLDSWLDEYEKQVFDGKTLKQLTKEGQNGAFYSR